MKKVNFLIATLFKGVTFVMVALCLSCGTRLAIEHAEDVTALSNMPLVENVKLTPDLLDAAREGRLGVELRDLKDAGESIVPVQWLTEAVDGQSTGVLLMPDAVAEGAGTFKLKEQPASFKSSMISLIDPQTGQINISEDGKPVLRYIYQTVYEDDEFAFNGLAPNEYAGRATDTLMANPSIYAVPRSNYIHPIFGPEGELLTRDWSRDHPHHRGIYWAWPEVDFGNQRGDLHALQKVFARPTGRIKLESGPVFAQVEAENLWLMEEGMVPIVREITLIRTYHQTEQGRVIDLAFKFISLKDSVTIARRGTNAYGGLNVRMMTPESQQIVFHTDEADAAPRRAWSDLSGLFSGANEPSGMMVFQHMNNPEYPGEWVQYPELSWVQPTFPTSGTRYLLVPGEELVLRFRLVVHPGMQPDEELINQFWDAYHSENAPLPDFTL